MRPCIYSCPMQVPRVPVIEVLSKSSVPVVPRIGDTITGKVLRVQQTSANCKIVCVGSRALDVDFRGVIR